MRVFDQLAWVGRWAALCIYVACLSLTFTAVWSQEGQGEDTGVEDKDYLTTLIEEGLSSDDVEVRLEGFEGALSSKAGLKRLTVADRDGVWLTLTDAQLSWNRAALLTGTLDVETLSAKEVSLVRLPTAQPQPAQFEAAPFELPQLPLAVELEKLKVGRIEIGEAVFGTALTFNLEGRAVFNDDNLELALDGQKLGPDAGQLQIDMKYDPQEQQLRTVLALEEDAGGILVKRLGIPGKPSLALRVNGQGLLSDFIATLSLHTDGVPRLRGELTTATGLLNAPQDLQRRTGLKLSGDLTALFLEEYRPFFGERLSVDAVIEQFEDGRIQLPRFEVDALSLTLTGRAKTTAEAELSQLDLKATIKDPFAMPVLLPIPGGKTYVDQATLTAQYNRALSQAWRADVLVNKVFRKELKAQQVQLVGRGTLGDQEQTSSWRYGAEGLSFADPAMSRALGPHVRGGFNLSSDPQGLLSLTDLEVKARDVSLQGELSMNTQISPLKLQTSLALVADDISQFSALSGRPLQGQGEVLLDADYVPNSGAFDMIVTSKTQNIGIGHSELDPFLQGPAKLSLASRRDESGIEISGFDLRSLYMTLTGSGALKTSGQSINLAGVLFDLEQLSPEFTGPLRLSATTTNKNLSARLEAPKMDSALTVKGGWTGALEALDMRVTGDFSLSALNRLLDPQQLSGRADLDVTVTGRPNAPRVNGRLRTNTAALVLPIANMAFEDISGQVLFEGQSARLDMSAQKRAGGRLRVQGPVRFDQGVEMDLTVNLADVILRNPDLYDTAISGEISLKGPVAQPSLLSGRLELAPTELKVPSSSFGLLGDIPPISHIKPSKVIRQTLQRAGMSLRPKVRPQSGEGTGFAIPMRIDIDAPSRVFIRGRGIDAELGGRLSLTGTTAQPIPSGQFSLVRGRIDVLSQRLTLTTAQATLEGDFIPSIELEAKTTTPDGTVVFVGVSGPASQPKITFSSLPDLPEDEVIAQLIFGRSLSDISPLQALQLADAVAVLAGSKSSSVVESLRENIGIDDLDVRTNEEGNTAVRAGAYLSENVYTTIELDSEGSTELNLNLEISGDVTAKGALQSDGEASLGVFFERDY